ncbi:MAG: Alginate regulatory protein AlgP [uncultured Ramlibacter sp.]|uniref:Alginate regulatory protein AlgP n=1 Tax=uncultured Ramlibacter sp. TaxID=260755 RepID=A0A6J4PEF6_9BURK|nr:MAG: Alginate regulatory protein AlgP [uncultured Ramlibacter sp.]
MSDNQNFGFGKFVPGFDFLQNLAKGASQSIPQLPSLSSWVAPTLNVEELEKRIGELRAVHFWLDQNSKALAATIQALEVQKMTLATLQGMNFSMGEVANALQLKAQDLTSGAGTPKAGGKPAGTVEAVSSAARPQPAAKRKAEGDGAAAGSVVDPLQWWGALTQQFQQIAADAMKDAARNTAVDTARNMATGAGKEALKTATDVMRNAAPGSGAKPARKAAAGKASRKTATRKPSSSR